jgi:hypothetical protein
MRPNLKLKKEKRFMDHNVMKDALKRRRANSLDLTIVLGRDPLEEEAEEDEDGELAPDVDDSADAAPAAAAAAAPSEQSPNDKLDALLGAGSLGKRNFLKPGMSKTSPAC